MNDPPVVSDHEHVEHVARDSNPLDHRQRPASEARANAFPGEKLHDEERSAVLGDIVVDNRDGTRVVDLVRDVSFAQKALHERTLDGELLNIAERETREQPTDDRLFDVMLGSDANAEAAYVKLTCRAELEAALATAMSRVDDRARCLLRHAFVDGRNIDEIGAIYGVHRATAARWIAAARAELVDATRADLMRRLGISATDAGSIIAAALSGVGSMLLARLTREP